MGHGQRKEAAPSALLLTRHQVMDALGVSGATLQKLLNAGQLDARKLGAKTVVTAASLNAYIERLPTLAEAKLRSPNRFRRRNRALGAPEAAD